MFVDDSTNNPRLHRDAINEEEGISASAYFHKYSR